MRKIRLSLTTTAPLLLALIIALAFAAVDAISSGLGEQNLRQSIRAFSRPIIQSSARSLFTPLDENNAAQVSALLSQYVDGRTIAYAAIYNLQGVKIAESLRGWSPSSALAQALSAQSLEQNDWAEQEQDDYLVVSHPISAGNQTLGAIVFAFDQRDMRAQFNANRGAILAYSSLVTLLAAFLTLFIIRFALRPLSALTDAARRIGAGELDVPVSSEGAAEFASLAESIEAMRVELERIYKDLREVMTGLERKVSERAALAEAARSEAEAARARLEEEVWLAKGQTAVAEVMRGEQTVSQLAQNVITRLCSYMELQSGALFTMEGDSLSLKGAYAVLRGDGLAEQIQIGEGLVGQAAAEGNPLLWSFPEVGTRLISTGLADFQPRQVLAFPFSTSDSVVGVIELASLSAFKEKHLELLRRVSETISMGFVTSQTRQRLNAAFLDKN